MKILSTAWIIILLLLLNIWSTLCAQVENLQFEHLSEKDGLSNNGVLSIHQDREGFIWFGTWEGLNKFDGYTFTVYQPDPNNPRQTLSHNTISDIAEDKDGFLWVATRGGGLNLIDKRSRKVTTYLLDSTGAHYWNALADIYEDRRGDFWICGAGGLAKFDLPSRTFTRYTSPEEESMIVSVAEDPMGRLWAASTRKLYQFDRTTGKFTPLPVGPSSTVHFTALHIDKEGTLWAGTGGEGLFRLDTRSPSPQLAPYNPGGLINKFITSTLGEIYEDSSGIIWLVTNNGLQRVDKKTDQVFTYRSDPLSTGSLSNNTIQSVLKDKNGHLWVGTINGINKWVDNKKSFHSYRLKPTSQSFQLDENNVTDVIEDETGKIWIGNSGKTRDAKVPGGGLHQLDPKINNFRFVDLNKTGSPALSRNQFFLPYQDQQGNIWIGTDDALLFSDKTTGHFVRFPTEVRVQAITEDQSGKLWFGGTKGGYIFKGALVCFDPETKSATYYWYDPKNVSGLNYHNISAITVSRTGEIWIATLGGGVNRFDPLTEKFKHYKPQIPFIAGIVTDKDIRAIYEDTRGFIWVGTNQGGLNRFDPESEKFLSYTVGNGLASNHVESIVEDQQGILWIGTSKGLSKFDPYTMRFRNYSTLDGLPDNSFNKGSKSRRDGKLFFGTTNGFVAFQPDSIKDNSTVPPVFITELKVLEKVRPLTAGNIELPHDENFLSFNFVALDYTAPKKNQYAYMLEGVDKDWVYSGTRRFANYTDLDPGKYTFRVKGSNNDGVWNHTGAKLSIIIHPPWWHSTWAYIGYGLLFALGLLLARKIVVNRERLRAELRVQQVKSDKLRELDTMKSRFFANISHEFRTPLSLISGTVQKLKTHTFLTELQKKDCHRIDRNANRLLDLINQLLDLSKLEAGKLQPDLQRCEVTLLLGALASSFESMAQSKGLTYRYSIPLKPSWAFLDKDRLDKIITNLLMNALKFTPAGGRVAFTASIETINMDEYVLKFSVEDTGIGISCEHLPHIFERFYQVDPSSTRKYEGAGIGLALTKELVELLGGTIRVESQEGQGSTFKVVLPLKASTAFDIEENNNSTENAGQSVSSLNLSPSDPFLNPLPEQQHPRKGKEYLVLVVEDNPDLRHFLIESFLPNYQVMEAADGQQGLLKALEAIPDLVISDMMMPGLDGASLCQQLKTDQRTSHIPIILLTAKADTSSKLLGLETGADDYLTKPFQLEELLVRVKNLLDGRKKLREQFGKSLTLQPQEIAVTSTDERFLQKALSIVEANMDNAEFDVEIFGKEVGMSRSHLHRKLKALTDQSPSEFIRTIRIKRAACLLRQQHGNVSEVAMLVGFSSLNYFTRCFRAQYGQIPSVYARQDLKV